MRAHLVTKIIDMKNLKIILSLIAFLALTLEADAQKFGYLNSNALLQELNEVKQAQAELDALQKQMQSKGEQMLKDLQGKYNEVGRKEQQGEISPKQLEDEVTKLRAEEQEIAQFEQEMQKKIFEKQNQLLQPIIDKVNAAITAVAKEQGYTYIFDRSDGTGVLLYADEGSDISSSVKAKLGI